MHKKFAVCLMIAAMAAVGSTSVSAQSSTKKAESPTTTAKQDTDKSAKKGEKPAASPGWVVIEEDWWYPHLYSFTESLHDARMHYRNRQEKAAAAEIDKAVTWLKFANNDADKSYKGDLLTAETDLKDFAMTLRQGGQVPASKVAEAFKNASAALAKHHHFKAVKALGESEMKLAAKHLAAASDLVKEAARSANREYGKEITEIDDYYSPFGYWDETVTIDSTMLEKNLNSVATELGKLAKEIK